MLSRATLDLAKSVNERLIAAGHVLATAESCTGGLVAAALTSVAGSSAVLYGGFVTYANQAKTAMIGVPAELISAHGAVSEAVARAMAEGARTTAGVDIAIAITGIAGPGGGSSEKPVGLVHFGLSTKGQTIHREERFGALEREQIRDAAVRVALEMVLAVYPA